MLKTQLALAGVALCLLPLAATAAPAKAHMKAVKVHAKAAAPTMYECAKCHMKVSAAVAKKDHYKDPMDGGKLVPVKMAKNVHAMHGMKMHGMKMHGMKM